MAFRGNESPMDFKWDGSGPIDATSPFSKLAMENAKKRSHSQFNSPGKQSFPVLREPNNQPYFLNRAQTSPVPSPYRQPSFTTPRKPFDLDFSSGAETTPGDQADNDDTPDGKPLPALPYEFKSKSSKRNSLWRLYGRFAPAASGRGEIKKPPQDTIARRIHKQRRQGQKFQQLIRVAQDSGSEFSGDESAVTEPAKTSPRKASRQQKQKQSTNVEEVGWMTGLFTFIHKYPDAPSIIAKYLQVFFNAAILFSCLYMFWSFYATIRADVDRASADAVQDIQSEIAACLHNYVQNRCGEAQRLPALEVVCNNWEVCMKRDPEAVRRASLSAHTFAEIFNSFVEPISLKTMIFTGLIVALALIVNNATFTMFRRSQEQHMHHAYPPQHAAQWMHGGPGNQIGMTPGLPYQTPQHFGGPWNEQAKLDFEDSPSKRGRSRSPEKKRLMLEQ